MPRPRYRITPEDYLYAEFYLSVRVRSLGIKFAKGISSTDAGTEYQSIMRADRKKQQLDQLNQWCEKYLSRTEWMKLKSAIRKRRERFRRSDEHKTVTLTSKAHRLLSQLAKRDNVTLSETLEHYLGNALNSGRGRPRSGKRR